MTMEEINIKSGAPTTPGAAADQPLDADADNVFIKRSKVSAGLPASLSNDELIDTLNGMSADQLIPWEVCQLPSRGLYYGWPDGNLTVRGFGMVVDKILANERLVRSGQAFDSIFDHCCRFPDDMVSLDLLVGDRTYLLYFLRGITHGNVYEFALTCQAPDCMQIGTYQYDLNDLQRTIVYANPALGGEPFKVSLPYMTEFTGRDFWVEVRFLRGHDANSIASVKKHKRRFMSTGQVQAAKSRQRQAVRATREQPTQLDDAVVENLSAAIVSVMGVTDRFKVEQFAGKMHGTDSATVRQWLRDHTPGIETIVELQCHACGRDMMSMLPFTDTFFRPTPSR